MKNTKRAIVVGVLLLLTSNQSSSTMSEDAKTQKTSSAIKKLWSDVATEREFAKREIIRLGHTPIRSLVDVLLALLSNQYPRFATGREEEGRIALENYLQSSLASTSREEFDRTVENASRLFINSRLISDVLYLLGELRAEEAIPICIKIMEGRDMYRRSVGFGDEMIALCKIGSPAVPYLITEVEQAEARALAQEDIHLGAVIHRDLDNEGIEDESDATVMTEDDAIAEGEELRLRIHEIRVRAIRILGKISDKRALAYLEKLVMQTEDIVLIKEIRNATIAR